MPGFDSKHVKELKNQFGVADEWPVVCEPFFQWVLEDNFPQGRPPLEKAGVQVVDDVEPFELMKLRLLNAGHQALGYFGYLSGYKFAYEAAAKDDFKTLLRAYMDREATPTLPDVPDTDLEEYKATLIERFANPAVADTLKRLCDSASDRIPKFVVPVARENVANGGEVKLAAAIVASWARYAEGVDEWGKDIDVKDSRAEMMTRLAKEQRESDDSVAFLRVPELFGDLADDKRFSQCYFAALWCVLTGYRHLVGRYAQPPCNGRPLTLAALQVSVPVMRGSVHNATEAATRLQ